MALKKTVSPFQLTIRWNPDGSIAAAYYEERVVIMDGKTKVSESMSPQVALDVADTSDESALGKILGRTLADAMAERASFDAKVAALTHERDAAVANAAQARAAAAQAKQTLEAMAQKIGQHAE